MSLISQLAAFLVVSISIHLFADNLSCKHLDPLMRGFTNSHVNYNQINSNLEQRTIDEYIKRLDGSKLYLLSGDIKWIRQRLKGITREIRKRNCEPLYQVQELYLKRVQERVAYASKWTKQKPTIDKKLELLFDPEEREYPKNKSEADGFQSKYLQFQLANFLVTDMKKDEAFGQLERRYQRTYKRLKEMDSEDILSGFLDVFALSLDPHSRYFSKDMMDDFKISMQLSLEGIGATLTSQDGYTVIEQLIAGGAAADSEKLEIKDKIIAVGQGDDKKTKLINIYDMSLRDVVKKIRGKKGTKVTLKILRQSGGETKKFNVVLVRKKISLESEAAKVNYLDKTIDGVKKKFAVLNLPSFYASSGKDGRSAAKDMAKILKEVEKQKVDGLVLDLASNGGGSLEDAVKIAGLFFKTGNVVETQNTKMADDDPKVNYSGPLVVLTNRLSASASEIVAGALKDYNRAVIVGGDHTFGKGSVQSVIPLQDGLGALKVTVGMFYIPGGKSTQHSGVSADVILPGAYSTDDVGEKKLSYSLPPTKVSSFISKSAFVNKGIGAWSPITQDQIDDLRKKSSKRVSTNKDFKKILEDLSKEKDKKIIKIAEILSGKDEEIKKKAEKQRRMSEKEKTAEYLKRADIQEALNVLSDLVKIQKKTTVIGSNKS